MYEKLSWNGFFTQCTHVSFRRNGIQLSGSHRAGTSEVFRSWVFLLLSKGSLEASLYFWGGCHNSWGKGMKLLHIVSRDPTVYHAIRQWSLTINADGKSH